MKSFGRVLTSLENLKLVEAKEKDKLEKLRQERGAKKAFRGEMDAGSREEEVPSDEAVSKGKSP